MRTAMSIEIKHLTHIYSPNSVFQSVALRDISFTIQDGDFLALVGHTGCGKSTLVQHLNGLLAPTEGQVLVDGQDLNGEHVNRRQLRMKIGLVFQYPEYQLFEETVAKDIAFGPKNLGLPAEEIDRRVRTAMDHVHLNYEKYAQRSPFELSGGQMRRVAIAGVLAMEPEVLILDEPTAGLDPHGRDRILGIVRELHASGTTVVMVSHSMDDVALLASRVAVLSHGSLSAIGTPEEIFSQSGLMAEAGLRVPETVRLCQLLRQRGLSLPEHIIRPDQLCGELLALWKEAHPC